MIRKLDHNERKVGVKIRDIFQASYAVEAEILKAKDFPPLQRGIVSFLESTNEFYGYLIQNEPVAVVEILTHPEKVHIQSLVVHPKYFRQGIASALIRFVFDSHGAGLFTVATGSENTPATTLYEKFGFVKTKQWETDHGVQKVGYAIRHKNSSQI